MSDPNFPPNLDIKPLNLDLSAQDDWLQHEAIQQYGIAGRIWEATELLIQYFTPNTGFDPPCPLFDPDAAGRNVIELGSGQSAASLHLAKYLRSGDTLTLTDLPEVIPLCEQSLSGRSHLPARIIARPLAWGSPCALPRPFTHIIMCDLIYFPHLYPSLLWTLLDLTRPESLPQTPTFGPAIILAYKPRTLALEHSFFDSFGHFFSMEPIIGGDSDVRLYSCHRWRITEEWHMPDVDTVMNGAPGVIRGGGFGYIEQMFASMEW